MSFEKIKTVLGSTAFVIVAIPFFSAWTFGGLAGAIWAALNDDLLAVVLSIFIPLYGAIYCIGEVFS